ncbi:hypothetical protein JB92DRAFT_2832339 [Gautieria morchelliformis]|nr:hypothetical protein JB92DRAFT_2832339 [Gautieria morchelliformis]
MTVRAECTAEDSDALMRGLMYWHAGAELGRIYASHIPSFTTLANSTFDRRIQVCPSWSHAGPGLRQGNARTPAHMQGHAPTLLHRDVQVRQVRRAWVRHRYELRRHGAICLECRRPGAPLSRMGPGRLRTCVHDGSTSSGSVFGARNQPVGAFNLWLRALDRAWGFVSGRWMDRAATPDEPRHGDALEGLEAGSRQIDGESHVLGASPDAGAVAHAMTGTLGPKARMPRSSRRLSTCRRRGRIDSNGSRRTGRLVHWALGRWAMMGVEAPHAAVEPATRAFCETRPSDSRGDFFRHAQTRGLATHAGTSTQKLLACRAAVWLLWLTDSGSGHARSDDFSAMLRHGSRHAVYQVWLLWPTGPI